MDTQFISRLLAAQHQHIDQGVAGIVDGTGGHGALLIALKLLREHVYMEEVVLFPPLAEAGLTMPVFVMKREHGQMWPLIRKLETACMAAAPIGDLHETARQLLQQLKIHNSKEEQIVYTAADHYDPAHPGMSLADAMASAHMPEGWICAMAPH